MTKGNSGVIDQEVPRIEVGKKPQPSSAKARRGEPVPQFQWTWLRAVGFIPSMFATNFTAVVALWLLAKTAEANKDYRPVHALLDLVGVLWVIVLSPIWLTIAVVFAPIWVPIVGIRRFKKRRATATA